MGLPATSPEVRCGYVVRVQVYQSARRGIVSGQRLPRKTRAGTAATAQRTMARIRRVPEV